jgi:hypothetical protein
LKGEEDAGFFIGTSAMARRTSSLGFDELLVVNPSPACLGAFCVEPMNRLARLRRVRHGTRIAGQSALLGKNGARYALRRRTPHSHAPPGRWFLGDDGMLYQVWP